METGKNLCIVFFVSILDYSSRIVCSLVDFSTVFVWKFSLGKFVLEIVYYPIFNFRVRGVV